MHAAISRHPPRNRSPRAAILPLHPPSRVSMEQPAPPQKLVHEGDRPRPLPALRLLSLAPCYLALRRAVTVRCSASPALSALVDHFLHVFGEHFFDNSARNRVGPCFSMSAGTMTSAANDESPHPKSRPARRLDITQSGCVIIHCSPINYIYL